MNRFWADIARKDFVITLGGGLPWYLQMCLVVRQYMFLFTPGISTVKPTRIRFCREFRVLHGQTCAPSALLVMFETSKDRPIRQEQFVLL